MLEPANMAGEATVFFILILTFSCILASEEEKDGAVNFEEDSVANRIEINQLVKADTDTDTSEVIGESSRYIYAPANSEDAITVNNLDAIPNSYENGITTATGTSFNASEGTQNIITNSTIQNTTSEVNTTEAAVKPTGPKWKCVGGNYSKEYLLNEVDMVDDSDLQDWMNLTATGSRCVLVLFYARFCRFSAKLAPLYNALARSFDNLPVLAIDAYQHNSLNARFGVTAVPTVLLFYSGKPVLKFNNSISLEEFHEVIKNNTGIEGNSSVEISVEDYEGPLSSTPTVEVDFYLILASLFLLVLGCHLFAKSSYGQYVWDTIDQFPWQRIVYWLKREKRD